MKVQEWHLRSANGFAVLSYSFTLLNPLSAAYLLRFQFLSALPKPPVYKITIISVNIVNKRRSAGNTVLYCLYIVYSLYVCL